MRTLIMLSRVGALWIILLSLGAGHSGLRAQAASDTPAPKPALPEELSRDELLKSYLQLREQLHAAELAIVNNRLEGEAEARVQAVAIAEKLDAIKAEMVAERARQQLEAQRLAAERERQQAEAQRSYRTVLYVAAAIGGAGLLAMLFTTLFQWRSFGRIVELTALRPQLPEHIRLGLLPGENGAPSGEAVAVSTQRLLSVIHRLERRISELEHTAGPPLPAATAEPPVKSDSPQRTAVTNDQATHVTALLEKGWSLHNRNRAAEAVACYDEVLKLDANHPEALVKKGAALEQLKQDLEALQCYDRAIKADPKMTIAYLSKGRVCNRLERYDEALECYAQAMPARAEAK
jgi:tetratricopeptide (TPR) repeat protein